MKWILNSFGGESWFAVDRSTLDGVELISLSSAVQTEHGGTEGDRNLPVTSLGGKIQKSGSTRYKEQPFLKVCFIFSHKKGNLNSKPEVDAGSLVKGQLQVFLFEFCLEEQLQPWRKSMISFSNCCSSETAEWAKHVWSFVLLRTISTPHTFLPLVCCHTVMLKPTTFLHQLGYEYD